jgi:hypothetical protein
VTPAARFRKLLRRDGMIIAPGAYDCITARMIARAGFDCVYMTGAGTAATLDYPDFSIVTMSAMVDKAGRIAAAVDLPGRWSACRDRPPFAIACNAGPLGAGEPNRDDGRAAHAAAPDHPPGCGGR